jgi:L-aspartate oxidase
MPELMRDWMWRYCGIVRTGRGLNECLELFDAVNWHGSAHPRRAGYECRNIHDVGRLIAQCALARRESRGGHTREDFPAKDPAFEKHSVVKRGSAVGFEA